MIVKMIWYINALGKKGNNSCFKILQIRQVVKTKGRQSRCECLCEIFVCGTGPFAQ